MQTINSETLRTIEKLQAGNFSDDREYNNLWNSLFLDCEPLLRDIATNRIGLDGDTRWDRDDFYNEVRILLFEKLNEIDTTDFRRFCRWLNTCAQNIINENYRHNNHMANGAELSFLSLDDEAALGYLENDASYDDVFSRYAKECSKELLYSELDKLPENYRDTLLLVSEDYKPREIADITGCNISDVYNYIKRSKNRLNELVTRDGLREELADVYEIDR